jgi:hypothetical protein
MRAVLKILICRGVGNVVTPTFFLKRGLDVGKNGHANI